MTTLLNIPDAMTAPPASAWPPAGGLALDPGYPYDPFQQHAILGIEAGEDVFVTAKTGSGKTAVGEYLIARALKQGGRVFYTTPIKSLSNQKYNDLKKLFKDATVGILTGDIKMCPDAQIVVMTAEILCNLLKKRGTATESVGLSSAVSLAGVTGIVIDEAHYIQDPDRGHVWEETLILCPPALQIVALSATLPSAEALAGWMATTRGRRTWLLNTTYRIVPLTHAVLTLDNKLVPLVDPKGAWTDGYITWLKERKALDAEVAAHRRAVEARRRDGYKAPPPSSETKARVESPVQRLNRCVSWLKEETAMPAIFFIFSRKGCEELAAQVTAALIDGPTAAGARHIFDFHLSRYKATLEKSGQYHALRTLIANGIAFHHSGLLPVLKEIVEILFSRGFIKLLFATETFSVGLNMPTKTVIFAALEKFSDGGVKRRLRTDEYTQMAGRAGRRGKDTHGLVLYFPLEEPLEPGALKAMITGSLPPLCSQMRFHYDFILKQHLNASSSDLVSRSYWAQQQKAAREAEGVGLERLRASLAKAIPTVTEADLALLQEEAALEETVRTTKHSAYKRATQARGEWYAKNAGPAFTKMKERVTILSNLRIATRAKERELADWDAAPLLSVGPQEAFLTEVGFLDVAGALTPNGVAATEINEGHPILMAHLAASGACASLTGEEVACILACFLREGGGRPEDDPPLDCLDFRDEVIAVLQGIAATTDKFYSVEERLRIRSPEGYWDLSSKWIAITQEWLSGATLSVIAARWNLMEGNLQRALLRIANILEEWSAIATLRRDLPALEKMAGVRFLTGRDEIIVDSLYLRL
jgi:superfamily II RNA helicase